MNAGTLFGLALILLAVVAGCSGGLPDRGTIDTANGGALSVLEADLKQRVTSDPEDARAWWRLAWVQLRKGDPESAEQSAWTGVQAEPEGVEGHVVLGWAQWAANHPRRSLGAFSQALQWAPGEVDARLGLALSHERLGHLETGQEVLAQGLRRTPEEPRLLYQSARLYHRARAWERAESQAGLLLSLQPGHPEASVLLGDLLRRTGRYAEGAALAESVVGTKMDTRDVRRQALELLAAIRLEQGRLEEAERILKALAIEEPLGVEALLARIAMLESQGQTAAVSQALEGLRVRFPSHPAILARLARFQVFEGRFQDALHSLGGGEGVIPDADIYYWRSVAAFQRGELALGESALAAAEQLAPSNPAVMLARIEKDTGEGALGDGGRHLVAFKQTHPGDVRHALAESTLAARGQRLEAAEAALVGFPASMAPKDVRFAELRIAAQRRDWVRAETLARGLVGDPVLGWRCTYLLGLALFGQNRDPEALQVLTPRLEQQGATSFARPVFVHLAGYLYWLTGDRRSAERVLNAELDRNPNHPLLLEALTRIQLGQGDRDGAMALLRKGAEGSGPWQGVFLERLSLQWPKGPVAMNRDWVRSFLIEMLMPRESGPRVQSWPLAGVLYGAYIPDVPPEWHPEVSAPPRNVLRITTTP